MLHRWSRSALTVPLDNSNPHASLASDMQAADLVTKRVRAAEQRRMSCYDEYIQCHRCDKRQSRLDIIAQKVWDEIRLAGLPATRGTAVQRSTLAYGETLSRGARRCASLTISPRPAD